jgi:hypothetical protein
MRSYIVEKIKYLDIFACFGLLLQQMRMRNLLNYAQDQQN